MIGKLILDTTVLIYSCDSSDAIKQHKALDLIAVSSFHHECGEVISEDLNDGQTYNGVLVSNPFCR